LKRRFLRECAFKALFMIDLGNTYEAAFRYLLDEAGISEKEQSYCLNLVKETLKKKNELDEFLSAYLVNWRLERLPVAVRNILRLALYELLYDNNVPPVVSINEAIELAKKFQDFESARFVNGILDKIWKDNIKDS